jgi:hypothetical protein
VLAKIAAMDPGESQDGLLRYCASNWLSHMARGCLPNASAELIDHDTAVADIFFRGAGASAVNDLSSHVAALPMSWGGFGMEPSHKLSPRAYLGAWLAVRGSLSSLYPRFRARTCEDPLSHPGILEAVQGVIEALEESKAFHALTERLNRHAVYEIPSQVMVVTDLERVEAILASASETQPADYHHAQKHCAVVFHLRSLQNAQSAADRFDASILNGASTKGVMTPLVPSIHETLRVPAEDYIIHKQNHLFLPYIGLPTVTHCKVCREEIDSSRQGVLDHIVARHSDLVGSHLHKPIVQQVAAMCGAQGFSARVEWGVRVVLTYTLTRLT